MYCKYRQSGELLPPRLAAEFVGTFVPRAGVPILRNMQLWERIPGWRAKSGARNELL